MNRHPTIHLDQALQAFLRESALETPLLQHRLVQQWPAIVGPTIAQHTEALCVKDQALWIRVHTPALRSQLLMMRQQLVRQLNAAIGSTLIYDLRLQ